jgi:hypothetical protein
MANQLRGERQPGLGENWGHYDDLPSCSIAFWTDARLLFNWALLGSSFRPSSYASLAPRRSPLPCRAAPFRPQPLGQSALICVVFSASWRALSQSFLDAYAADRLL